MLHTRTHPYKHTHSLPFSPLPSSPQFPEHRTEEIAASIRRGLAFLRRSQRDDGSWYGAWAVCFTYATWFGTSALRAAIENGFGQEGDEERLAAAAAFLRTKQREDGGWGETYLSCVTMQYCQNDKDGSTAPNTAWALLALLNAVGASEPSQEAKEAIDRCALRPPCPLPALPPRLDSLHSPAPSPALAAARRSNCG